MRQVAASAIVLDVADLGERDRVVGFLTAEHGKKRGAARGARSKFSRFGGQLQPLARVHLTWFEHPDRELVRLTEASVERSFAPGDDLERLLVASYLADAVTAFAQENEDSHTLFRLLEMTATQLIAGIDPGLASRYFEVWVLRLAGIFPPPRACPTCGRPYARGACLVDHDSGLVCPACAGEAVHHQVVSHHAIDLLLQIGGVALDTLSRSPPAPAVLLEVEQLCARIRRAFLGRELRSYGVMRQTLRAVGT